MTDWVLAGLWLVVLGAGVGLALGARRLGVPGTYARDLLHVGAGVWVLGWPWWDGLMAPLAIVGLSAGGLALVGWLPGLPGTGRLRRSVTEGDETFGGLVVYSLSFAVLTFVGLAGDPFPAAAGLLALALGDGLGGLIGRASGRWFYRVRLGKRKSLEGSVAVALFSAAGVALAAAWFGAPVAAWHVLLLGVVGAVAEGAAPRGWDNALVPLAVWSVAALLLG